MTEPGSSHADRLLARLPDQQGRTALVTGANGELGLALCRGLAAKGATVVMACRDAERGAAARDRLLEEAPGADLHVRTVDLASLSSVRAFARHALEHSPRLDLLFLNAGVMAVERRETVDGHELQFAVNHLAHFALVAGCWPALMASPAARVVATTSNGAYAGRLDLSDVMGVERYDRWHAYNQSKLCNVLFTHALDRRLREVAPAAKALSAHPGLVYTNLQRRAESEAETAAARFFLSRLVPLLGQSPEMGVAPLLHAALHPDAQGGELWGPRWAHVRGAPRRLSPPSRARDIGLQEGLWRLSERLTGVSLPPEPSGSGGSTTSG